MVTVRVELFARARELYGESSVSLQLPAGADVEAAVRSLVDRAPGLAALEGRLLVAVNEEYASRDRGLREGDRLALIPPVSGG